MADDNQASERLAFLENRAQLLCGAVFGLAKRFAGDMDLAPLNADEDNFDINLRLIGQISAIEATPGEHAALVRAETAEAAAAEALASLKAVKGHETRAKNALAVLRAECSPTARKVGRPVALFGKPGVPFSPELAAIAIGEDEYTEIVFSDGKAEITSLPPVKAYPNAWLQTGGRHMLREPIELEGGDEDIEVAGFALLSVLGEQIGWRELPDPIRVPKNGRVRLENCITF